MIDVYKQGIRCKIFQDIRGRSEYRIKLSSVGCEVRVQFECIDKTAILGSRQRTALPFVLVTI